MGFMKFMKKDNTNQESLDIPPPPPIGPMEVNEGAAISPPFLQPSGPGLGALPPLPNELTSSGANEAGMGVSPLSQEPKKEEPMFPLFSEQQSQSSFDIPPIRASMGEYDGDYKDSVLPPVFPKKGVQMSNINEQPGDTKLKPFNDIITDQPPPPKMDHIRPSQGQVPIPRTTGKQVFIEVVKYKTLLKDLNNIQKALKQSGEDVNEIMGDIRDEEETFSNLHKNLSEVEKKLVELEEGLFS